MELNININTQNQCKITIEDLSTYLSEDDTAFKKGFFRKSDTASMTILYLNSIDNPEIKSTHFNTEVPIEFDGWFTVNYIVLPTKEWVNQMISSSSQADFLGVYEQVYYLDNEQVFKYNPKTKQTVLVTDLQEILEVNPISTTISKISKELTSVCLLQKCYVNLCKQIFDERGFSQCWNKNNIDSELIYKRDLVWMALNVIKYMVECNQLYEAERIIELMHSCNGVCGDKKTRNNVSGCGCS